MAVTCVSYYPTELETQRFWEHQAVRETAPVELPDGLPKEIKSTLAWKRDEIEAKQDKWRVDLSSQDVNAVDAALAQFEC